MFINRLNVKLLLIDLCLFLLFDSLVYSPVWQGGCKGGAGCNSWMDSGLCVLL